MDAPTLERLSNELVRLCDNIEKHGLVDYQMGVAEEDIMECMYTFDVVESDELRSNPRISIASLPIDCQSRQRKNGRACE